MSRKNTRKRKIRFKVNNSKMPRCLFTGKLKLRPKIAVSLLIHPGLIRRTSKGCAEWFSQKTTQNVDIDSLCEQYSLGKNLHVLHKLGTDNFSGEK